MEILLILGLVGAGFFFLARPATAQSTLPVSTPIGAGPEMGGASGGGIGSTGSVPSPILGSVIGVGGAAGTAAITAATHAGAGTAAGAGAGAGISAATAAITAGIGAAVTIFAVLWGRHKAREKQATDENSAMNIGVAGFDQDIRLINSDFNAHKIDVNTAIAAVKQALSQYWMLVTPKMQPGRNGCQGGAGCSTVIATGNALIAKGKNSCNDYPGKAIGASCCVGCFSLHQSVYGNADGSLPGIIKILQQGGNGVSHIVQVFPSKYGGNNRAAYDLTWRVA